MTLSAQHPVCPLNSSLQRTTPTPFLGCSCFSQRCGCWWCSGRLRLSCILLEAPSLWRLCAALRSVCCPPISIKNVSGAFRFSGIQIASGWLWIQKGNDTLWGKTFRKLHGPLSHSFILLMTERDFLSILYPFCVVVTVLWEHWREKGFAPRFRSKTHQIIRYDPARVAWGWERSSGAVRVLPCPDSWGTIRMPAGQARNPLLVFPAQPRDRWKGEAMKVKPQRVHVAPSLTCSPAGACSSQRDVSDPSACSSCLRSQCFYLPDRSTSCLMIILTKENNFHLHSSWPVPCQGFCLSLAEGFYSLPSACSSSCSNPPATATPWHTPISPSFQHVFRGEELFSFDEW